MATNGKLEALITIPTGGWNFDVTETGGGGASDTITVPAGTYYHSSVGNGSNDLAAEIQSQLNAATLNATYAVSVAAGEDGTGKYTITASGGSVTAIAFTWTDTDIRDVIGFDGTESGTLNFTGNEQAEALWLPNYPFQTLNGGGSWKGIPVTDKQDKVNANGNYFGVRGAKRYELRIMWPMINRSKVWSDNESTTNESFQTFMLDGIQGEAVWGQVGGPVRWYPDADTDATYNTYSVPGFQEWEPSQVREMWVDQWSVEMPRMVEVPS